MIKNHVLGSTGMLLIGGFLLSACTARLPPATQTPTLTPEPSATAPDPCAPESVSTEVDGIHRHMREFDDAFSLAASMTRDMLPDRIAELQRIRREAQDLKPSACVKALQELELVHMNTVIRTFLAFMNGADQEAVNQGMTLARQIHNQYMLEMARTQGTTPAAIFTPISGAFALPTGESGTPAPTPNVPVVINSGTAAVNLRIHAALDAQTLGLLEAGASALALGRTADGFWLMVEVPGLPGQVAWVYSGLVQVSGPIETLPFISP